MDEKTGEPLPGEGPDKSASPGLDAQAGSSAGGGAMIMKILGGLASMLGLGPDKTDEHDRATGDVGTDLAYQRTGLAKQRTGLALDRNMLAAERTLMAWIRTSLSMISFGFTIGKLGQILHEVNVQGILGRVRSMSVQNIAYFLVILGTGALIGASFQHWRRMRELRAMGLRRQVSITFLVALLLSAVGLFTLSALILAL